MIFNMLPVYDPILRMTSVGVRYQCKLYITDRNNGPVTKMFAEALLKKSSFDERSVIVSRMPIRKLKIRIEPQNKFSFSSPGESCILVPLLLG